MTDRRIKLGVIGPRGIGDFQGGIEYYCRVFYSLLPSDDYDITIFVSRESKVAGRQKNLRTRRVRFAKGKYLETVICSFFSVLLAKASGITTLHFHGLGTCLALPLACGLGIRCVVRHMGREYDRTKWGCFARIALILAERFAAKYADVVVCVSHVVADDFALATGRRDKVAVIENAIAAPVARGTRKADSKIALLEACPLILFVGRFVPEKNVHILIEAFRAAGLPDTARLLLVGDLSEPDGYISRLLSMSSHDHRIIFSGALFGAALWDLYERCDLYVLPSMHEGMSFSLLEAALAGANIIASDIRANADVCRDYAKLVQVNSVDALAREIAQQWWRKRDESDVKRQIDACRHRHGWDRVVRSTHAVLSDSA